MKTVYKQIYEILKRNEEKYEKGSREYLSINIYCNSHLNHYKEWASGTSELAIEIAKDSLSQLLSVVNVLGCLDIISESDRAKINDIVFAEQDRLQNMLCKETAV